MRGLSDQVLVQTKQRRRLLELAWHYPFSFVHIPKHIRLRQIYHVPDIALYQ